MKKIAALILALTMVLALAACVNKNSKSAYLGEWVEEKGYVLTFLEDGTGSYKRSDGTVVDQFTYEIKNGTVIVKYEDWVDYTFAIEPKLKEEKTAVFKLNDDGTKLVCTAAETIQNDFDKGTEYTKR